MRPMMPKPALGERPTRIEPPLRPVQEPQVHGFGEVDHRPEAELCKEQDENRYPVEPTDDEEVVHVYRQMQCGYEGGR